ncbi:MAG TPA: ATP-binding protein [Candidatus Limnocylindria bacterium]|nr:ATP-binding protein [Candidatus Limnocylindria bacterium]
MNFAASNHDKSLPENCIDVDLPGLAGRRWVKGIGLYGSNASGKTTLILALQALGDLVENSSKTTDAKESIRQIEPFALVPGQESVPTAFAVTFVVDRVRYEYRVAATRERVWHESLRAFPKAKEQVWYQRNWRPDTEAYEWSPERPAGFQRDSKLESYTLPNALFLSKAVANNRQELDPVYRWFKERLGFLSLGIRTPFGGTFTLNELAQKTVLQDQIVELLRHADLGVTAARAVQRRATEEEMPPMFSALQPEVREKFLKQEWLAPQLSHRGRGSLEVALPWEVESAGTQRLFALAGPWLDILKKGHAVCVDELETSMHPLVVMELLRLFFSQRENHDGAQILFTTHSPLLLAPTLLRRDQVWFTEKDDEGASHLYPLTDFQPRKGESLVRGYLSGRYGAVPFVPAGLLGSFPAHQTVENPDGPAHE